MVESNPNCTLQGDKIQLQMIDEFQCPGCIHGTDPETCSKFELAKDPLRAQGWSVCKNWRPSTFMGNVGRIALGLPRGFTRTGMVEFGDTPFIYMRLYAKPEDMPEYNKFNVPVWAMEKDGYLYVRCYSPRTNCLYVDVVKDGKMEHASYKEGDFVHKAVNVGEFFDQID